MTRILFLFNHDTAHQVAHLAGVAAQMARRHADVETLIAVAPEIRGAVESAVAFALAGDAAAAAQIQWHDLALPRWTDRLAGVANRILPARRLLRLRHFAPLLQSADMVVSTERTCLKAKSHMRGHQPLFAIIPHGAGDRNVSYHADFTRFDLVLVSGEKVASAMRGIGVAPSALRITGYPKFDAVDLSARVDLFGNGRPTFVYNPHFDPHLSSWYALGPDLLRWFASADGQGYNLIFAPHVMLFRKSLHISPEYRVAKRRPDIPAEAVAAANIHIDVDSPHLFDMRYMVSADGYIGDMSSQIYEFLARPRPAYFFDVHHGQRDEPEDQHLHWRAGPVVETLDAMTALLPDFASIGASFHSAQVDLFGWTFDQTETSASARAADALVSALPESAK